MSNLASTSKHPLITPSPTPFSQSLPEGPSPTKKSRTARSKSRGRSVATPGPVFAAQTFFRDESGEGIADLHEARRASSSRVLDIWSQLAERYSRPLAEDDIVDLRTEKIIQDRNVLRSAQGKYDIGYFGDQGAREGTATPTEEGEEEASEDELDAFAPGADISDELELIRISKVKEREMQMDPADLEDLREFMEAENKRREAHGSDEEEFIEEDEASLGEGRDEELGEEDDNFLTDGVEEYPDNGAPLSPEHAPRQKSTASASNEELSGDISSSEDELGKWGDTEDTVYAIAGDLNDDEETDVVELPLPSPSPAPTKAKRGRPRKDVQTQAVDLPVLAPPPRVKPKTRKTLELKASQIQLHTPPQSSSSTAGNTPDIFTLSPMATSSPPSKSKFRSQTHPRLKLPSETSEYDNDAASVPCEKLGTKTKPSKTKGTKGIPSIPPDDIPAPKAASKATSAAPSKKSKMKHSEVLIEDPSDDQTERHSEAVSTLKSRTVKPKMPKGGKGKGKAKVKSAVAAGGDDSDDPMILTSSPVHIPVRKHGGDTPDTVSVSESESQRPSTPPRARKRKRVPSSSLEGDSQEAQGLYDLQATAGKYGSTASPDIDIIDFRQNRYNDSERVHSPIPQPGSRGKVKVEPKPEREKYEDPDPVDALSPLKIIKRAASTSRTRVRSTPAPVAGPSSDTSNYAHSEHQTLQHVRHSNGASYLPYPVSSLPPIHPHQPHQYPAIAPIQGSQAQFLIAQAMHHLSYLMSTSGHGQNVPLPHREQAQWLSQGSTPSQYTFGSQNPEWAFATPTHHRHRHPSEAFDSFETPSAEPSVYSTPVHPHPYPRAYTPSFSSATLPPSSPPDQSPEQSPRGSLVDVPLPRASSLARGRSKSIGRRVSFRIDDEMAHGLNKHDQRSLHFEAYEDEQEVPSSPLSKRGRVKNRKSPAPREASLSPNPEIFKRRSNAKSKARIVAAYPGIDERGSGQELDESSSRGRSGRGQTPGPPVRSRPTTGTGRDKRAS